MTKHVFKTQSVFESLRPGFYLVPGFNAESQYNQGLALESDTVLYCSPATVYIRVAYAVAHLLFDFSFCMTIGRPLVLTIV